MSPVLVRVLLVVLAGLAGAAVAWTSSRPLLGVGFLVAAAIAWALERPLRALPASGLVGGVAGLAVGLTLALGAAAAGLLSGVMPAAGVAVLTLVFGWLGAALGARHGGHWWAGLDAAPADKATATPAYKLLDTSVIIDGRVADVVGSGFVEGVLVVPQFILRELQRVADSSDPLKRNRGRKGLDVLKELQVSDRVQVEVSDDDAPELQEVDSKLLAVAVARGAKIVTNDYNLNKIAQLRGIQVLNVNDLANAVKPVVLPGETLALQVIKEGKERNQGVGYLDDGTMVVIDNGKRLIGQTVEVIVTSVIQTNAGKMIFCMTEDAEPAPPRARPVVRRNSEAEIPSVGSI